MAFVGHFAASGRMRTKVLADMGIAKLTFHSCALPLPRVIEQCVRRLAGDINLYCEECIDGHHLVSLDGWQDFDDLCACDRCGEELYELTPTSLLDHTETLETEEQYRSVPIGTVIHGEEK